jgi:hypothetical protein
MKLVTGRFKFRMGMAFAAGLVFLLMLHTEGRLLHPEWMAQTVWLVPAALAVWWVGRRWPDMGFDPIWVPETVLLAFLFLGLLSSATLDIWFYFLHWQPVGFSTWRIWRSGFTSWLALTSAFTVLLALPRVRVRWLLPVLLVLAQVACFVGLYHVTGGEPLYKVDHPSFMQRLDAFAKVFPHLYFYDPMWNGGKASTYLVSTGSIALGVPLWPLLKILPVHPFWTFHVGFAFIVFFPLLSAASARIAGGDSSAAWCAALLGLGVSLFSFVWVIHFGTVGAGASCAFALPVAACLYRIIWLRRRTWATAALLVSFSSLMLAWPAAWVWSLALVPGVLISPPARTWRTMFFLLGCAAAIAVLCMPMLSIVLVHVDPVAFINRAAVEFHGREALADGWATLCKHFREAHPWLLFFGLGGILISSRRGVRRLFGGMAIGLVVLAGWGQEWKPQLQLDRVGIPLMWIVVLPAGLWASAILRRAGRIWLIPQAGLLALLFFGGLNTAQLYANRGPALIGTMSESTRRFVEWVPQNVPEGARVLFAGPTVHGYGGGQVAALPLFTGREMMACDYYNFSPKKVEYEYPPKNFRQPDRVFEFMELYNVSHVVTYHDRWKRHFRADPERYREVFSFGEKTEKTVFEVRHEGNLFLRGSGRVEATANELRVTVDNPNADSVIRYNWQEGLKAAPPAHVYPFEAGDGIRFVGMLPGGRKDVVIRFTPWL